MKKELTIQRYIPFGLRIWTGIPEMVSYLSTMSSSSMSSSTVLTWYTSIWGSLRGGWGGGVGDGLDCKEGVGEWDLLLSSSSPPRPAPLSSSSSLLVSPALIRSSFSTSVSSVSKLSLIGSTFAIPPKKWRSPFLSELNVQPLSHRRVCPTERKKSSKAECRWIIEVTTGAQPFTIFRQPSQMFFERHLKTGDGLDQLVDQEPFVNCVMIVLQLVSHAGCPLLLPLILLWWGFDRWWGVATRRWGDLAIIFQLPLQSCNAQHVVLLKSNAVQALTTSRAFSLWIRPKINFS